MFCPSCGRDNSPDRKFCATCGTNLEAVSQALSGSRDDFFTKTDAALDQLIARYAEHVFRDAPAKTNERKVSNSWKVLGQGVVTSFVDLILFSLMWNILPLRFLMLLISTPFRLLSQRSHRPKVALGAEPDSEYRLREAAAARWLPSSAASITESTTQNLEDYRPPERKPVPRQE